MSNLLKKNKNQEKWFKFQIEEAKNIYCIPLYAEEKIKIDANILFAYLYNC